MPCAGVTAPMNGGSSSAGRGRRLRGVAGAQRGEQVAVRVLRGAALARAGRVLAALRGGVLERLLAAVGEVGHRVFAQELVVEAERVPGLVGDDLAGGAHVAEDAAEHERDGVLDDAAVAVHRGHAAHTLGLARLLRPAADDRLDVRRVARVAVGDLHVVGREQLGGAADHLGPVGGAALVGVDGGAAGHDARRVGGRVVVAAPVGAAVAVEVEDAAPGLEREARLGGRRAVRPRDDDAHVDGARPHALDEPHAGRVGGVGHRLGAGGEQHRDERDSFHGARATAYPVPGPRGLDRGA